MRAITLAAILLCINMAIGLINVANDPSLGGQRIFTSGQVGTQSELEDDIQQATNQNYTQSGQLITTEDQITFSDITRSLVQFVKLLGWSIVGIPWLLIQVGVPSLLAYLFSFPMYFIYAIGIVQLLRGTDLEG